MTAVHDAVGTRPALRRELLRSLRPKQWVKNLLVLFAPAAAGVLLDPRALLQCLLAALAVTSTASACYLVNDLLDRELDRAHPRKRHRPIAAGNVPPTTAVAVALVLLVVGLLLAAAGGSGLLLVVAVYAGVTLAYALVLKAMPWIEMAVVASGFVLRTLAGAAATSVPVSGWFFLVVSAAAVLVVASKRASELQEGGSRTRPVLRAYSEPVLRRLRLGSAAVLVLAYTGWALTRPATVTSVMATLSVVPLVTVVGRWTRQTDRGRTGAPEEVLIGDSVVRFGVLAWGLCFAGTVLAASWSS